MDYREVGKKREIGLSWHGCGHITHAWVLPTIIVVCLSLFVWVLATAISKRPPQKFLVGAVVVESETGHIVVVTKAERVYGPQINRPWRYRVERWDSVDGRAVVKGAWFPEWRLRVVETNETGG